jgi:hypothetical protein
MVVLRESEIDALVRRVRLAPESRSDLNAVTKALYGFLDDTASVTCNRQRMTRHPDRGKAATRRATALQALTRRLARIPANG